MQRQSAMLAYVDVFQILSSVVFGSLLLVFFMRGQSSGPSRSTGSHSVAGSKQDPT